VVSATCTHLDQIELTELAESIACCEERLKTRSRWVHLSMCMTCGRISYCDWSPNKNATAHFREVGHPIMRSAEPGEDWSSCYVDQVAFPLARG
jgi:hypothetical protein